MYNNSSFSYGRRKVSSEYLRETRASGARCINGGARKITRVLRYFTPSTQRFCDNREKCMRKNFSRDNHYCKPSLRVFAAHMYITYPLSPHTFFILYIHLLYYMLYPPYVIYLYAYVLYVLYIFISCQYVCMYVFGFIHLYLYAIVENNAEPFLQTIYKMHLLCKRALYSQNCGIFRCSSCKKDIIFDY